MLPLYNDTAYIYGYDNKRFVHFTQNNSIVWSPADWQNNHAKKPNAGAS